MLKFCVIFVCMFACLRDITLKPCAHICPYFCMAHRYDAKVKATRERMQELGLLDTSWLCLDQWEVPRDRIVLNRKLGEGAFGTVYGGEALIDDGWVAVAVKTLKIGSNPEEKVKTIFVIAYTLDLRIRTIR